ncbi:MAG: hypothetical protein K8F25_07195, partial [Fimbriimonadaceae bacterium]|nr:hypothetical protein [Alphaproteobacteria bacterium]
MGTFARKFLSGLAFSVCLTGAANSADILPPIVEERVVSVAGGWYLRGDIGYDIEKTAEFSHPGVTAANGAFIDHSIDRSGSLGVGVGYEFNDWFRADVTAEFRGTEGFAAVDRYQFDCAAAGLSSGSCG